MAGCDVLIVGGGPAGSSCAWALRDSGLDVAILDKHNFPRHKVCGGWITPAVIAELQLDPAEYSRTRVLQPITGFRTSYMGGPEIRSDYGATVSYGIRRCEFDDFLLRRSGARLIEGTPLNSLERTGDCWLVNGPDRATGAIKARIVVGAGGHFCPVARFLGANARAESAVAAQEVEFEMTPSQRENCSFQGEIPELFFCADMKGYGWCFRKGNFLNVGLGRLDPRGLPQHVANFVKFLKSKGKLAFDLPASMLGHGYLLYQETKRKLIDDAILLVGDSAGLAYSQSGEGIRPAIESGLFAAQTILAAAGDYSRERLENYRRLIQSRLGTGGRDWSTAAASHLPSAVVNSLARVLLAGRWFPRRVVLDQWFLHVDEPALPAPTAPRAQVAAAD
jgi:geranylgeranyl reductase family protein